MLVLVNFATKNFRRTQRFNSWTGKHIAGFDQVYECVAEGYKTDPNFYKRYEKILRTKKGAHLWKPYFVLKVLEELDDGDILFYCDAGTFFFKNIRKYLEKNVNDIWASDIPFIEEQFSNTKAFDIVGISKEVYRESNQIQSGFVGVRKNRRTVKFMQQWFELCCNEDVMINDAENEGPRFVENRDDQTALSLLCKKEGIVPYPDPTQYGKVPEEYMRDDRFIFRIPEHNYKRKMFIILHRTPDINFKVCFKQIMVAILPRRLSVKMIKKKRNIET